VAGLVEVPCHVDLIRRADDIDAFVRLLVSHNNQRIKTFSHKLHEEAVKLDPAECYARLIAERAERSKVKVAAMDLDPRKTRSKISDIKKPMLDAVLAIFERIEKPTDDRTLFYQLINNPPLRNARTKTRFRNDRKSYSDLCDLLTRARLEGIIPWEWIVDETRPVTTWDVHRDPQAFISAEMRKFLTGYYRDLLQSQPNYIEVLLEKNTLRAKTNGTCSKYCVPVTSGRGFCSSRPRWDLLQRYRKSGKDKLILLIVSDLDPSGMYIAQTFAQSMRDDFGVEDVHAIKVAITGEQIQQYKIPHGEKIKAGDKTRGPAFRKLYGEYVYEVEALPDGELPKLLAEPKRFMMFSGESGLPTLQETARRISRRAGYELGQLDGFSLSPDLPQLDDANDIAEFEAIIAGEQPDVVAVDPMMLCLGDVDEKAANMFSMGKLLRRLNEACLNNGATLVFAHHTSGPPQYGATPKLSWLAYSGFKQFVRQWVLLNRMEEYAPGSGLHRLKMVAGGSSGHNGLWIVEIDEGSRNNPGGRHWHVAVKTTEEAKQDSTTRAAEKKTAAAEQKLEAERTAALRILAKHINGLAPTTIRDTAGISGRRWPVVLAAMLERAEIVEVEVITGSPPKARQGYKLANSES
jgi:hypothetical protein